METSILKSLEIHRFRTFRHLQIPRLGLVNLVTGRNNVGKSCLLEALWLYARRGSQTAIWQLLKARDESGLPSIRSERDAEEQALDIKHLFYGRKDIREPIEPIKIGSVNSQTDLFSISVDWATWSTGEGGRREIQLLQPDEYHTVDTPIVVLVTQFGTQEKIVQRIDWRRRIRPPEPKGIPCVFVPANGLEALQVGRFWDAVVMANLEEDVLISLRIIAPKVERVNLIGEQETRQGRIPIVKIPRFDSPIPLRSMGEGMNRIFGVALALVNAKEGILLIDEIDSGLHYSVQPDMWRLIFRVANRLNVQVFATTHSWDCVEAFQQAVQEDGQGEGLLISLRDKEDEPGQVAAVLFDEQELAVVTREQIEVR